MSRVLWISKASVAASYRVKLSYIKRLRPDWDIAVVTGHSWGPIPFEELNDDIRIYQLPQLWSGKNHFHVYRGLSRVIENFKPDILHIDEEHYSIVTAQAVYLGMRWNIPIMLFQTWQNIHKNYPWPFSGIEKYVFSHVSSALAGTEEIKHVIRRKGFAGPTFVVPLGTHTDAFYPISQKIARQHMGFETNPFIIGYVGRFVKEKGLSDLFDAVIPLLQFNKNIRMVLVGEGPWIAKGQEISQKQNVHESIMWLPWQPSKDMPYLMNALDVLVLPSQTTSRWKEQFGRVLTEAMAVGTPVVGSSSGEIPHVIDEAGLVFEERNPAKLRYQIEKLYQDPVLRNRLSDQGKVRVTEHFTQKAIAEKIIRIYQELLTIPRKT